MNSRKGQVKEPVHRGMEKDEKVIINFSGKSDLECECRFGDGPTQHSMIRSRVSLAQVTSLGRSSVYVIHYVFVRVQVCVAWI